MPSSRENLIKATKGLLWKVGYEAMSPGKVLKASGAGQGSLYHHFDGKKDLAAQALAEIADEMLAEFDDIFLSDLPPLEKLDRYLGKKRNGMKGCRLGRLANESSIAEEALRGPIAGCFEVMENRLAETIAEAVRRGEIPKTVDPVAVAHALAAVIQGGFILSRIHKDRNRIQHATDGAAVMLHALKLKQGRPPSMKRRE